VPEFELQRPAETSLKVEPLLDPPPPTVRRLLFGDEGLRAGWSVLVFFLLVVIVGTGVTLAARALHLDPPPPSRSADGTMMMTPRYGTFSEAYQFLIFAIPAFLMSLIERRPFGRYGLPARRMLPDFCIGLFWGLVALSALVGLLYLAHGIAFDGVLLHGITAALYALKWALVFLLVALSEEFLFRGYLQYTVARGVAGIARAMDPFNRYTHVIGFGVAAFLFSICLFALAHTGNGGETALGIFQVALVGSVFAFSLYRTGSLWWAVGVHTSWDWAQSFLYGTPDSGNLTVGHLLATHPLGSRLLSGGPAGPEGSVLGIPVVLALGAVIYFTLPRRNYALTPDQSSPVLAAWTDPNPSQALDV
jgi:membrane protease YdiL (CAAX protease family)